MERYVWSSVTVVFGLKIPASTALFPSAASNSLLVIRAERFRGSDRDVRYISYHFSSSAKKRYVIQVQSWPAEVLCFTSSMGSYVVYGFSDEISMPPNRHPGRALFALWEVFPAAASAVITTCYAVQHESTVNVG